MSLEKTDLAPASQANGKNSPHMGHSPGAYRNKTWKEAEGQKETSVRLDHLPLNLTFPENFPEPITYDAARKLLKYRGLMFSGSYAYLRRLSTDPAYLAALDQLFIGTSTPTKHSGGWFLVVAGVAGLALAVFSGWWYMH